MRQFVVLIALAGCYNQALYAERLEELQPEPCEAVTWYADGDADGFGGTAVQACVAPTGHVARGEDCDDANGAVNPDADEVSCNGLDDDCSSATPDRNDADGDGFDACLDCDDADALVYPGRDERCNGADDDCDGDTDEGAVDATVWFEDADGDGAGAEPTLSCTAPAGHVAAAGDCNDADPHVHPLAVEDCDLVDRNCDGDPVLGTPLAEQGEWFHDGDNDGVGTGEGLRACLALPASAPIGGDCDDADASVLGPTTWFLDLDGDGFGTSGVDSCDAPPDHAAAGGDCDDTDPARHPSATETPADGRDQDCDGFEACWVDGDSDGFGGSLELGNLTCAGVGGDCNDAEGSVNPGEPEVSGDGIDQNCDGEDLCFADTDGDGWGAGGAVPCTGAVGPLGDCNDHDAAVFPGAVDDPGDGVDGDCDGVDSCWIDGDGDGFGVGTPVPAVADCALDAAWAELDGDCAVNDGDRFPGASETVGDGVDQDCDGVESCYPDLDADGVGGVPAQPVAGLVCEGHFTTTAGDCADDDPLRRPGAAEVAGDGIDQDCDGLDLCYLDGDGDGYGALPVPALVCIGDLTAQDDDCDDSRADVNPAAHEVTADGVDSDCDSLEWCYLDEDGDGYGVDTLVASPNPVCVDPGEAVVSGDCADDDPHVYPGLVLDRLVPSVYPTVPEAVEAACDSDRVVIERGVYADVVDAGSKELVFIGEGADLTVLAAPLRLEAGRVEGITLQDGVGHIGGCLLAEGPVDLVNVDFLQCTAVTGGGAWLAAGSTWTGGSAIGNAAQAGGGVWLEGDVLLLGVHFEGNTAGHGAAVGGIGETVAERLTVLDNSGGSALELERGELTGVLVAGNDGDGIVVEVLQARQVTSTGNAGAGVVATTAPVAEGLILAFNGGVGLDWLGASVPSPLVDSLVFGNAAPAHGIDSGIGVNGVFASNPLFLLFPTSLPTSDWDLHLRPDSPGIDLGAALDPDGSPADAGGHGGLSAVDHGYYDDTDLDGLYDGYELVCGLHVGLNDADADPDGDNIDSVLEQREGIRADRADTDFDGVDDAAEIIAGTDPRTAH